MILERPSAKSSRQILEQVAQLGTESGFTRATFERWPECLPYHGTIPPMTVVPHLTISDTIEGEHLDGIERAVSSGLPVAARVAEALLFENNSGRWTTRRRFPFG